MNRKRRVVPLLLTFAMIFVYMPAMAFAGSGQLSGSASGAEAVNAKAKPTKMTFTLGDSAKPLNGYIGSDEVNINQAGNKIVLKYSNGTTKTYKCVKNMSGYYRYYLNGNTSKAKLNELSASADMGQLEAGNNAGHLYYWYNDNNYVSTKVNIAGVSDSSVTGVSHKQNSAITVKWEDIMSEPLEWQYEDKFFMGNVLTIADGAGVHEYTYQADPEESDYCNYLSFEYDPEEDEYFTSEADVDFMPDVDYYSWVPGKTFNVGIYYRGVRADEDLQVNVTSNYSVPNEVIFTPAEGFAPSYPIGESELWIEPFTGAGCEGSSFTVRYSDGIEKTYIAVQNPTYGYYSYCLNGDLSAEEFDCNATVKGGLRPGANDVTFTYEKDVSKADETASVQFNATVYANKYYVDADTVQVKYTGKDVTPKFVVRNSVGKTLTAGAKAADGAPATGDYYVEFTPQKTIGMYSAEIVINDGIAERELYDDSYEVYYNIVPPKAPVIKSVKGGSKSLTVKWSKFTAAQRKLIDGFYIEVATDTKFNNNYKSVRVSKTAASKTIKGLKKGKKYYVRMYAYKNVKPEGATQKFTLSSANSKRKSAKTK